MAPQEPPGSATANAHVYVHTVCACALHVCMPAFLGKTLLHTLHSNTETEVDLQ